MLELEQMLGHLENFKSQLSNIDNNKSIYAIRGLDIAIFWLKQLIK